VEGRCYDVPVIVLVSDVAVGVDVPGCNGMCTLMLGNRLCTVSCVLRIYYVLITYKEKYL
jgi:hypothetical protein